MLELIADIYILLGSLFILIAALGVWRLQDIYLQLHAATKAGTLGASLILLGVGLQIRNIHTISEIILLILFVVITNPISAHLIGKIQYQRAK